MIRKYFLLPAFLALALLFTAGNIVQAQHHGGHGGGHGGHGGHSSWHGGGGWHGGHSGVRIGFYPSFWYGGYGGYGRYPYYSSYYPYYSSYYYPNYYPSTTVYTYPTTNYYTSPVTTTTSSYFPAQDTATVRVILPDPRAQVWFNGALTQQTGTERTYYTPPLTMGTTYTYTVRATWMEGNREVTQERVLSIDPGGNFVVDFSRTGERIS